MQLNLILLVRVPPPTIHSFALDFSTLAGHIRKGKYVPDHLTGITDEILQHCGRGNGGSGREAILKPLGLRHCSGNGTAERGYVAKQTIRQPTVRRMSSPSAVLYALCSLCNLCTTVERVSGYQSIDSNAAAAERRTPMATRRSIAEQTGNGAGFRASPPIFCPPALAFTFFVAGNA
ncbi:hypothetical protein CORC01_01567 [Colletotrichum orchidophilum]|uniref:Uncharacterized protein n=1 Tax=Colletotrichum orchidophilum TaxID=1209926 RepID=A0A1G4BPF8_9PEZI|nr:uncharacterized protein CORC01_01567 [Colletotrichum orchidophilum]OHF03183.1 hypothetical protein CORC01_01567 [Colletotrichum orchidophilum]